MSDAAATPDTPATRALAGADLEHRVVVTERARSAEESASFQGLPVGRLLKSIVVRRGEDDYVFVLVPGDRQIDWRKLRKHLGVSRLSLPERDEAERVTGYVPGTITPFGARTRLPVIVDSSVGDGGTVTVGGGAHGVNIHVDAARLISFLEADSADVTSTR
jgi:Cys-tRNA(Pro) deacylase